MSFEILSQISAIEIISIDTSIREIARLRKVYGPGRWRKLKGRATIRLEDGLTTQAELHWYECHGMGRKEIKIKRYL